MWELKKKNYPSIHFNSIITFNNIIKLSQIFTFETNVQYIKYIKYCFVQGQGTPV